MPVKRTGRGVTVALRVTPGAAADRISGLVEDASGARRLKLAVTAPPDRGRANDAVVRLLARACRAPKSSLSVISGRTDRNKVVAIDGDPAALERRLHDIIGAAGRN